MRLFIALHLPKDIEQYISSLADKLNACNADIKTASTLHLTLAFLGEVSEESAKGISAKLRSIDFVRFNCSLSILGAFPSPSNPKVVWAGLDPKPKLTALSHTIHRILDMKEDKRFMPHITLARVRRSSPAICSFVSNYHLEKMSFCPGSFELVRSTLTREGPVYDILESFPVRRSANT